MDTGLDAGFEWIQDLMQDGLDTGLDAGFEQHHVQDEREGHSVGTVPTQRPKTKKRRYARAQDSMTDDAGSH